MQQQAPSEYRVYVLDERGHFIWAHEISAPDDTVAMERASILDLPHGGEVWQRARRVALLKADPSNS